MDQKTGVLLINLGTPDAPDKKSVYRYLKQFLLDPRVIDEPWLKRNLLVRGIIVPFRAKPSSDLYKQLWTEEGSPLKVFGYKLRDEVQNMLGEHYVVELGMRYQNPSIESAIDKVIEQKVSRLLILPLFPQYASATTGSVHEEVMRILSKRWEIPEVKMINSFYDFPEMIDAFVERGKQYEIDSYDHILFSYHGLPERQLIKADTSNHCLQDESCCQNISEKNQFCYSAQCYATTAAITKKLNLSPDQYTVCFQSRLGKTPWIQPYTSDVLEALAEKGAKKILVFCPAFICDCIETTIEISEEYQEEFEEMGGEKVQLVEGLNDHPLWINAVTTLVKGNL
ncbi:MAG: ferrochelatase [Bacteroidota bacterium]